MHVLAFFKGNLAHTRLFDNIGFSIRGGHAINWPKYKEEDFFLLLINLPKVIQWTISACSCSFFFKGKQAYTRFIDNIG